MIDAVGFSEMLVPAFQMQGVTLQKTVTLSPPCEPQAS
jgi:hypothetical protein